MLPGANGSRPMPRKIAGIEMMHDRRVDRGHEHAERGVGQRDPLVAAVIVRPRCRGRAHPRRARPSQLRGHPVEQGDGRFERHGLSRGPSADARRLQRAGPRLADRRPATSARPAAVTDRSARRPSDESASRTTSPVLLQQGEDHAHRLRPDPLLIRKVAGRHCAARGRPGQRGQLGQRQLTGLVTLTQQPYEAAGVTANRFATNGPLLELAALSHKSLA